MKKKKVDKSELKKSLILTIKDTTLFRLQDEQELVIMNMEDNRIYKLEGMSLFIWTLLNGQNSVESIIKKTEQKFKLNKAACKKIEELLEDLFLKNLITTSGKKNKSSRPIKFPQNLTKRQYGKPLLELLKLKPFTALAGGCGGCGCAGPDGSAGSSSSYSCTSSTD